MQDEGLTSISHREGHHMLRVNRRSMIFEETRQAALRVNSLHHQAVDFADADALSRAVAAAAREVAWIAHDGVTRLVEIGRAHV